MAAEQHNPVLGVKRRRWIAPLVLVGLYLCAAMPLILVNSERGRGAFDQINYHEPAIRTFAAELDPPASWPDLSDYLSATTPGYHLVLAAVARYVSDSDVALRLAGAAFTVGLLGLLGWWLAGRLGVVRTLAVGLPALGSLYVFGPGVWLLPDNAGWLGVLVIVLLSLGRPRVWWPRLVAGGAVLVLLVCVRQIHIWSAAVLWAAAWLGSDERASSGPVEGVCALFGDLKPRIGRTALAVLLTLPAFGMLAWFAGLWGGVVPPMFQHKYGGMNPAAPAFVLTLFGVFGLFFWPVVVPGVHGLWREHRGVLVCVALAGLLIGLVPETSYDRADGRYSGLWNVVRALPVVADRSPAVWLGSVVGAVVLAAVVARVGWRSGWVLLGAVVAFTAAQTASHELWQRYSEPFVLLMLAVAAGLAGALHGDGGRRWVWLGPVALGVGLALAGGAELAGSSVAERKPIGELLELPEDPASEPFLVPGG